MKTNTNQKAAAVAATEIVFTIKRVKRQIIHRQVNTDAKDDVEIVKVKTGAGI